MRAQGLKQIGPVFLPLRLEAEKQNAVELVEIVGQLLPLFERGRRKTIEFKQTGRMRGPSKGRCLPWALTHRPLLRGGAIERARVRCVR